ncbi:methyltransferase domain-containing protein [Candidatus Micrarchaeota archaeon]|nr:methyltransferase domain-containing protein [Candidatus Micrarchaeota archaeon]
MAQKLPLHPSKKSSSGVPKKLNAPLPKSGESLWDSAYRLPLSEIPWEIENPPKELLAFLASGRLKPVKTSGATGTLLARIRALDVACGSGNYSIFLAKNGFDVTGVDFSKNALEIARNKAKAANVSIGFVHADVRHLVIPGSASALEGKRFDFILDWSLLHHIAPADLTDYAAQFGRLLAPGGVLLLSCFSDRDAPKSGLTEATGKMGNVLFYRTREEIEAAYRPLMVLQYGGCRLGKSGTHAGHYFLLGIQP